MPLFDFLCKDCQLRFEQLVSSSGTDEDDGKCPKCKGKNTEKLFSRFAISGQGDQRESTQHGCHNCHVGHKHGKD